MQLIQLLLPLYDNAGRAIAKRHFRDTAEELTTRFGGLTAHTRAPEGLWKPRRHGRTQRDDLVILEVIAGRLERRWWNDYRRLLERRFRQEKILIRALRFDEV